jgi:uncharacterized protein YvpB
MDSPSKAVLTLFSLSRVILTRILFSRMLTGMKRWLMLSSCMFALVVSSFGSSFTAVSKNYDSQSKSVASPSLYEIEDEAEIRPWGESTSPPSLLRERNVNPNPSVTATPNSMTAATPTPVFIRTPNQTPTPLPWKAYIDPIYGQSQQLHLDCESRAAADWAAFFHHPIDELEFFHRLPSAMNPNNGFVGDVNDYWGRLPPFGYGVYAGPVARTLRSYGVTAYAYRGVSYEQLKIQIATGHPVMVWVIGHIGLSKPVTMVLDGSPAVVAPYEHVVLFIGYEYQKATVLDGSRRYPVWEIDFQNSWKILGNMAVTAKPIENENATAIPFEDLAP